MTHTAASPWYIPADWPAPDANARALSAQLLEHIKAEITAAGGWIDFARYMELALYAPGLGYYSAGARKFGAGGDFITAPEVSSLFSRCVARSCAAVLEQLALVCRIMNRLASTMSHSSSTSSTPRMWLRRLLATDASVAPVLSRVTLAVVMFPHGAQKLLGWFGGFGFTATIEAWTQKPDKMASQTALGPFTLQDGYDGTTAWRVDQNGKLSIRDGKDHENEKGSAWFENGMWLTADQGGGSIKVQGQEKDSTGAWTVLEVTPPIGRVYAYWFNTKTGLLDRAVTRTDQQTVNFETIWWANRAAGP